MSRACREDVERSLAAGASGIWVTNHGGLDRRWWLPLTLTSRSSRAVYDKRVPIVFDSGIRRGQHVFKNLGFRSELSGQQDLSMAWLSAVSVGVRQVFEHL